MKIKWKQVLSLFLCAVMILSVVTSVPTLAENEHDHDHDDNVITALEGELSDVPVQGDDAGTLPDAPVAKPLIMVSATETDEINGGASSDSKLFCAAPTVTIITAEGRKLASVTVTRNGEAYDLSDVAIEGQDSVKFILKLSKNATPFTADTFVITATNDAGAEADPVTIQAFSEHSWLNSYNGVRGTYENVEYPATCTAPAYFAQNYYCGICREAYLTVYVKPEMDADGTYNSLPEAKRPKGHNYGNETISNACGTYTKSTCSECGYVKITLTEGTGHVWGNDVLTAAPDCDTDGYTYHICTVCNEKETIATIPATGHVFGAWKTSKPMKCGENGEQRRTCSKCGAFETKVITAPSAHTWERRVIKAATCTEPGESVQQCKNCGEIQENSSVIIPSLGHVWYDVAGTDTSSCTEDGTKTQKCSRCSKEQEVVTPARDHMWQGQLTKAASCSEEGIMTYTCTRCYETKEEPIAKIAHTLPTSIKNCTEDILCTVCGQVAISGGTHTFGNYVYNKNSHWKICTVCGYREEAAHDPDNDANCTTSYICSCGYTVPASSFHIYTGSNSIGHNETQHWYVCGAEGCNQKISISRHSGGVATCTEKAVCGFCGTEYGDLNANNHVNTELRNQKNPTQTEEGYTGDVYCLDCKQIVEGGTTLDKLPSDHTHTFDIVKSDSTGHWHECSCGVADTDLTDHVYGSYTKDENGHSRTCIECGYKSSIDAHIPAEDDGNCETAVLCTLCGEEVTPAQTHAFTGGYVSDADGHWQICTNAECRMTSTKVSHSGGTADCTSGADCEICNSDYGEKDPSNHIGGTYVNGQIDATEFVEGYTGDICCAGCNAIFEKGKTIPAIGHIYQWHSDGTLHWQECETCHAITNSTTHSFGEYTKNADGHTHTCTVCGYTATENHVLDIDTKNCTMPLICTVCKYEIEGAREHTWGDWTVDGTNHTKACLNPYCSVTETAAHTGGMATCVTQAECEICHTRYGSFDLTNHANNNFILQNYIEATETAEGYTGDKVCADCYTVIENGQTIPRLETGHIHNWGILQSDDEGHWRECTECHNRESSEKTAHTYDDTYKKDIYSHWLTCSICGYEHVSAHTPAASDGDCTTAVLCSICNQEIIAARSHNFSGIYFSDANGHWHVCTNEGCHVAEAVEVHSGGTATCVSTAVCADCGMAYGELDPSNHIHTEVRNQVPPTETEAGYTGDLYCSDCGLLLQTGTAIAPNQSTEHIHNYTIQKFDNTHHWLECECGERSEYAEHTYKDNVCTVCGATKAAPTGDNRTILLWIIILTVSSMSMAVLVNSFLPNNKRRVKQTVK